MLGGGGLGRGNTSERLIQLLCVYVKKHMFRSGTLGDLLFNSYLKPGQRLREGGKKKSYTQRIRKNILSLSWKILCSMFDIPNSLVSVHEGGNKM